jgi:hypothetical protein
MDHVVRIVSATLGGAIAIRSPDGREDKMAVFADAGIEDFAMLGGGRCLLISRNGGAALLDLAAREVVRRTRLSFHPQRVVAAPDGQRAIVYFNHPAIISVLDVATLSEIRKFNLARRREGGDYDLLFRSADELKADKIRFHQLPNADAPLRVLKMAPGVTPRVSADGKLFAALEYHEDGPEFVYDHTAGKPMTTTLVRRTSAIGTFDLDAARLAITPLRQVIEHHNDGHFQVRLISGDGRHVVMQSTSLLEAPAPKPSGALDRIFGRRTAPALAYGLELWDLGAPQPARSAVTPYQAFRDEDLMHPNTVRLPEQEAALRRRAADLLMPGLEAAAAGQRAQWERSEAKRREDDFFQPFARHAEHTKRRQPMIHLGVPSVFGPLLRTLLRVDKSAPQGVPWEAMTDRQKEFVSEIQRAWGFHAKTPVMAMAWTSEPDRIAALGRNGIVREISFAEGPGPAWQLVDPPQSTYGFDWISHDAQLIRIRDRTFAVDYHAARFEFDLPASPDFGAHHLDGATPLPFRIIKDRDRHQKEVAEADRLTRAIRPGYVTIKSSDAKEIIAGLGKLATEVRTRFDEIVVDYRWTPALFVRGKAIEEQEFSEILVEDGSDAARAALQGLLEAYVEVCTKAQNVWHPDDHTPTMGAVAFALVKLSDAVPECVTTFCGRRDMDHDGWTFDAFGKLDLPADRLTAPDLLALQFRLAIQDISTGNIEPELFRQYGLRHARLALDRDPALAEPYADLIAAQLLAQSNASLGFARGADPLLTKIADALGASAPAEAGLAAALRKRLPLSPAA